jgi:hypothetical protein
MAHDMPRHPRRLSGYPPGAVYRDSDFPDHAGYQRNPPYHRDNPDDREHADFRDPFDGPGDYRGGRPGAYQYRQGPDQAYQDQARHGLGGYQDKITLRAQAYEARYGPAAYSGSGFRKLERPGLLPGGVVGIIALVVTLSVGTLAAGFMGVQASPVIAMGRIYIVAIPAGFRSFAAHCLGSTVQPVLLLSLYVVIEIVGGVIGVIAARRKGYGALGIAFFSLLAAFAVLATPGSRAADAIPSAVGGLAGIVALLLLVRAFISNEGPRSAANGRLTPY